jgi:hypothetical protein
MPLSLTDVLLIPIERPRCAQMPHPDEPVEHRPASRSLRKTHLRMSDCDFIETRMVSDSVKSKEVTRLADNIRPPA